MISPSVYFAVLVASGFKCTYCRVKIYHDLHARHPQRATVDHIVPRSRGGSDAAENLCACCYRCNQDKADLTPDQFRFYQRSVAVPGRKLVRHSLLYASVGPKKIVPFVQNHALTAT